jgi:hypothetical protein
MNEESISLTEKLQLKSEFNNLCYQLSKQVMEGNLLRQFAEREIRVFYNTHPLLYSD